jgi:hypothetical protein
MGSGVRRHSLGGFCFGRKRRAAKSKVRWRDCLRPKLAAVGATLSFETTVPFADGSFVALSNRETGKVEKLVTIGKR